MEPKLVKYDYVIVGAGLYGAIFAYEARQHGFTSLVIESRDHIGGNCYTRNEGGINVHEYGPHIFHTNNKEIWDYVNQFAEFNNFTYRPKVLYEGNLYSFPINLMTINQITNGLVITPNDASDWLKTQTVPMVNDNLEEWAISQVGSSLYYAFIKGYTTKQWNKDPRDLPSSIIKRLPVRLTYDDNYFNDRYQGIPIGGYTQIFEKLLSGVEVLLNTKYKPEFEDLARYKVVYTGTIDGFFNYQLGKLEYRSLKFRHTYTYGDAQGTAVVNYTDKGVPYTRVIEHKHFEGNKTDRTVVTHEFPDNWDVDKTPYYPINTEQNKTLFQQYKALAEQKKNILFGGRLGCYQYFDMHQIVGMALKDVETEFSTLD